VQLIGVLGGARAEALAIREADEGEKLAQPISGGGTPEHSSHFVALLEGAGRDHDVLEPSADGRGTGWSVPGPGVAA